jgi:hypothetical protein
MDTNAFCDALLSFLKSRFPNDAMFSATSPISDDRLKGLAKEALLNSVCYCKQCIE